MPQTTQPAIPSFVYDSSRQSALTTGPDTLTTAYSQNNPAAYSKIFDNSKTLYSVFMGSMVVDGSSGYGSFEPNAIMNINIPITANTTYDYNNPQRSAVYDAPQISSESTSKGITYAELDFDPILIHSIVLKKNDSLTAQNYKDLLQAAEANIISLYKSDATKDNSTDPVTITKITPKETPGTWNITYNYDGVTKNIQGTTTDKSSISAQNFTINYGADWNSRKFDGLTAHTDSNGKTFSPLSSGVTLSIKLNGKDVNSVDTTNSGAVYDVTYTIPGGAPTTIKVTVGQRNNTPNNNISANNNSNNNSNNTNNSWNPDGSTGLPNYAAVKGSAVYATKRIYMYRSANFKKSQRTATYPKAKRVNRPMFVVLGYAKSNGGALRYKVCDVNHGKKTDGKIGYISANPKYVVNVYYKTMPKDNKITVVNKKGIHAYKHVNLTGQVKTFKKGTHLTVKSFEKHNLTTRYKLSNGTYITANKKLVIQGNY